MPPFVSASVIVVVRDHVLAVVDPLRAEAVLPGGHVRWGEHPSQGAIRETREETGYMVTSGDLVGVYAGPELAGEYGVVRVVYSAQIIGGSLRSSSEGKAVWLSVRDYAGASARDSRIVQDWLDRH